MKTNIQKSNWIIDALLFVGFLIAFALDLTGLSMHQWLGVFIALFAVYHLILHWDWVVAVTARFFGRTSGQARAYYLLDGALLFGLFLITGTGLVISTWFNLTLANYSAWAAFHEVVSYVTLALVVLKIALHWRWIVRVARQFSLAPQPQPVPALKPAPAAASVNVTRRDFLKLMGIVGAASVLAFTSALNDDDESSSTSASSSTTSTTSTTSSSTASTSATTCTLNCPKNKHCSFPGDCRRYQDTSGNGRCDLGECA